MGFHGTLTTYPQPDGSYLPDYTEITKSMIEVHDPGSTTFTTLDGSMSKSIYAGETIQKLVIYANVPL